MIGGQQLHIRAELSLPTDSDLRRIQKDRAEVYKHSRTKAARSRHQGPHTRAARAATQPDQYCRQDHSRCNAQTVACVEERSLVPLGEARLGRINLDEWLRRSQAKA
jgi:hypothetical protein